MERGGEQNSYETCCNKLQKFAAYTKIMFPHTINVSRLCQIVKVTLTIFPHMDSDSK